MILPLLKSWTNLDIIKKVNYQNLLNLKKDIFSNFVLFIRLLVLRLRSSVKCTMYNIIIKIEHL